MKENLKSRDPSDYSIEIVTCTLPGTGLHALKWLVWFQFTLEISFMTVPAYTHPSDQTHVKHTLKTPQNPSKPLQTPQKPLSMVLPSWALPSSSAVEPATENQREGVWGGGG